MTTSSEFAQAVLDDIGAAATANGGNQANVGPGIKTQWFPLIPRVQGEFVEAALITAQVVITSGAVTVASVASAVQMDAAIAQVFVAPQPNTSPRSYTATRLGCQEMERIAFGRFAASVAYPGTAVASIASVTTVSYTVTLLVPVGGEAAALQVQTPPVSQAYTPTSGAITSSVTFTVRAISGLNPTVVTFREDNTTTVSSGAAVDISTFLSDPSLSADFLCLVGTTLGSLTGITVIGADGTFLIDYNDGLTGAITNAQKYFGGQNYTSASMVFSLRRQGVRKATINSAAAQSLDILRMEFAGGTTASPQVEPAQTSTPPASGQTGQAVAGGANVVQKGTGKAYSPTGPISQGGGAHLKSGKRSLTS